MSVDANRAALERAGEQWNAGNLDGYLKLYSPDVVLHGYPGVEPGFTGVRRFYETFFVAFPGSQLIFEDVFGLADKLTCRFIVHVTHCGTFQGIPATGREATIPGITILQFQDSKCVERWSQADFLGLLVQLGAIPGP